jgi:uncharacterized protein YggE
MSRHVEVTGTGAATAPPDRLDLAVAVSLARPAVGTALADLGDRVRALAAALRETGVEDLGTTSSSLGEDYVDGRPDGFRATQDLRVRLDDPDRVGAVLDAAAVAAGDDLRLHGLSWALADQAPLAAAAREAALADARATAEHLASLAGATLGDLLRITEAPASGTPLVRLAAAKADAGFAAERGETRVEVSLTVRWALAR